MSTAIIRVCDSVILSVCPYDKTKTAETKIAKLGTEIVHHLACQSILGEKVKGQGHSVTKCKKVSGRCELCSLSSAQPVVNSVFQCPLPELTARVNGPS